MLMRMALAVLAALATVNEVLATACFPLLETAIAVRICGPFGKAEVFSE
jgi:hypothetical protein